MKINLAILLLVVISLTGCLSDLRNEFIKSDEYNPLIQSSEGKKYLAKVAEASGEHVWKYVEKYEVDFNDSFNGLIGSLAKPYKDKEVDMLLEYSPKAFGGKMTLKNPKQLDEVWIYEDGKTLKIKSDSTSNYKTNKKIKFWVPTYQYFIEFPFKIREATNVSYAGKAKHAGKEYDLVLASWNDLKPQKEIDQYLLWINPENNRIEILEYTIREQYGFIKGVAFYEDYFEKNGVWFPAKIKVRSNREKGNFMHVMSINDVRFIEQQTPDIPDFLNMDIKQIIVEKYYGMTDETLSKRLKITEERAIRRLMNGLKGFPSAGNIEVRFAQTTPRYKLVLRGIKKKYELEIVGDKIRTPQSDNGSFHNGTGANNHLKKEAAFKASIDALFGK